MPSKARRSRLKQIAHLELGPGFRRLSMYDQARLQVEKWTLVQASLAVMAFADQPGRKRSEQWQRAAGFVREIGATELLDWALQQAEIARNIEANIRDLRPRKGGETYKLTCDFAEARLGKARTVLAWVEAAIDSGADQGRGPSRVFSEPLHAPPKRDDSKAG